MKNKIFCKQLVLFFLIFSLSAAISYGQACGDADNNGSVNDIDALVIAQYYIGLDPEDLLAPEVIDVNCDGKKNIVDAFMVALYYVDLIPGLACCTGASAEFPYSPYKYPSQISSVSVDQNDDNVYIGDMCQEYDLWKQTYVTAEGAGGYLRISNPEGSPQYCTQSEGIGFGMLLAVYMDDPYLFEGLWNYALNYGDGKGLMNREISSSGTVSESGSNTNADIDMAAALVFAAKKWGGMYESDAGDIIDDIFDHDVYHSYEQDPSNLFLKSSDSDGVDDWWGKGDSYPFLLTASLKPAFMKIFADFTDNKTWITVAMKCYDVLEAARNETTGLIPDWCSIDGTPGGNPLYPIGMENFFSDAARVPHNIGLDYLWFNEPRALGFCTKITDFFLTQVQEVGIRIWSEYELDGDILGIGEDAAITGCAGVGALAASGIVDDNIEISQNYRDFAQKAHLYIKDWKMDKCYQDTYRLLNMLILSGNFPNLYAVCTTTIAEPAPTPDRENPCPTPSPKPACAETPGETPEAPLCPVDNLVSAGCFESTADLASTNWALSTNDSGALGEIDTENFDYCMHIVVGGTGDDWNKWGSKDWNIQVTQWGINMDGGIGASYTLSFDGRTNVEEGRKITINIGTGASPYNSFSGEKYPYLTCDWTHFEYTFESALPCDDPANYPDVACTNARFEINAGRYEGDVYLDNIILIKN